MGSFSSTERCCQRSLFYVEIVSPQGESVKKYTITRDCGQEKKTVKYIYDLCNDVYKNFTNISIKTDNLKFIRRMIDTLDKVPLNLISATFDSENGQVYYDLRWMKMYMLTHAFLET